LGLPFCGIIHGEKGKKQKRTCGMSRGKALRHVVMKVLYLMKSFYMLKNIHGSHVVLKNEDFEELY
jgi:hypothetical protein